MSITALTTCRVGGVTRATATSDLSGTVYFHWYLDGVCVASGTLASHCFALPVGRSARLAVIDTTDADFDPVANAPDGWPAWRSLFWVRSLDSGVDYYRIDQKLDAGDWSAVGRVAAVAGQWSYSYETGQLADLGTYTWRIVPVDAAGNDGTPTEIGPEKIVRTPDAPEFTATFDEGSTKVTFAAAS